MSKNVNIMVVDDDFSVLRFVEDAITILGYQAHTASSGKEALEKIIQMEKPVDLLFTDVVMPFMTGIELAEKFQEMHPDKKILFMCGFVPDFIGAKRLSQTKNHVLQKPFTLEELRASLDNLLEDTVINTTSYNFTDGDI